MRIVAWIGGLLVALGISSLTFSVTGWLKAGRYPTTWFWTVALVVLCAGWLLRRLLTSPFLRTVVRSGTWASVVLLTLRGFSSGLIDTKIAVYTTTLKSDLRYLADAEEAFKRDSGRYASAPPPAFERSTGTTNPVITLTRDGWTASQTHKYVQRTCTIFVGSTPLAPAAEEGEPACTRLPFEAGQHAKGAALIAAGVFLAGFARARERRGYP